MNRIALALALALHPSFATVSPVLPCETLHGTAVLVEAGGAERADLDGSFLLEVQDAPALSRRIEVHGGRWRADVPGDALVRPVELELGGRAALTFADWSSTDATGELAVRGEAVRAASVLRVVAAEDGRELDAIEIVYVGLGGEHPGLVDANDRALEGAASPATLPLAFFDRRMRTDAVWVRAPGRAWRRVAIDLLHGGEQRVELVRGGDVALSFVGPPLAGARVLLAPREYDWRPVCSAELDPRGVRIEGVEPGRYVARVVLGPLAFCPIAGEAPVAIEPGATASATISVQPLEAPPPGGRISIHVAIGDDWGDTEAWLEIGPEGEELARWIPCLAGRDSRAVIELSKLSRAQDGSIAFAWDAPYAGRYVAYLWPMDAYALVDVDESGGELRIEAPRATRVSVHLVDAASGEGLAIDHARWSSIVREQPGGADGRSHRADPAPGADRIEFLAASGRIVLSVRSADGRSREEIVALEPGERSIEWTLDPR